MNSAPFLQPPPAATSPTGRTLADYLQSFALDLAPLRGRAVLDVAAGLSSFAAEACRRGIDAVAVDPLYQHSPAELAELGSVKALRDADRREGAEAEINRRIARDRFLTDYASQAMRGRYYAAALPYLPFLDRTFDLVLCRDFLFGPDTARLPDFAINACRELLRVTRHEVRIFPVAGASGRLRTDVATVQRLLAEDGARAELLKIRRPGRKADVLLVLKPQSSL